MEKRICLLAGYDKNNTIEDYVVFLVQELSKISDVYYFADGEMPAAELSKIRPYTEYAESAPHQGHDFGSWQYLIHYIGWNKIGQYDEMIICNDSIYGPMTSMQDIFDYMELRGYDFWGLTENYHSNYHLDSYFMVFNNDILKIYFQKDKGEFFAKSVKFKYPRQRKTVVADGVGQGYKEVQEISPNLRYIIDELDQICQRDRSEVDLKRKILDDLRHLESVVTNKISEIEADLEKLTRK